MKRRPRSICSVMSPNGLDSRPLDGSPYYLIQRVEGEEGRRYTLTKSADPLPADGELIGWPGVGDVESIFSHHEPRFGTFG